LNEYPPGFVQNSTGITWNGFDISVQTPALGNFVESPTVLFSWSDNTNTFPNANLSDNDVFLSGGSLAGAGNEITPSGYFVTNAPGTFVIRETPTTAPEPASSALSALGILALGFVRRKSSKQTP
jgi:hypothetical protein